jgi:hypothetical protein
MAKWTVERMAEELKNTIHDNLVCVILYGSGASGDHAGRHSDYNLMVVTHRLKLLGLQNISKLVVPWVKQGNPAPLFVTMEDLEGFVGVFPVEISDIKENHRVLFGSDPFANLPVSHENLRQELEHELQGKVLQLKTRFMMTEGKPKKVQQLMVQSLSTFLVLFKSALWLFNEKPPLKKMEALKKLQERRPFDIEVFQIVDRLKRGERMKDLNVLETFEKYLETIEEIVKKINI